MSEICPECGNDSSRGDADKARIADLEAQVKALSVKAATSADKLADYEDEIRYLKSQNQMLSQSQPATLQGSPSRNGGVNGVASKTTVGAAGSPPKNNQSSVKASPPAPTTTAARLANLTSYFPGRRAAPAPLQNLAGNAQPALQSPGFPPPKTPTLPGKKASLDSTMDVNTLTQLLDQERVARQKLEAQISSQSTEVEDLTAQLFSQANEMVAVERKAKARLEGRVRELEKGWEIRRERLRMLEARVDRAQRIRGIVGSGNTA